MKEYIFLFNVDDDKMINFLQSFLDDDVLVENYGLFPDRKDYSFKSIWVTKDKYKYAFAIMESPTYSYDEDYEPLTSSVCEKWMQNWIEQGYVLKR